MVNKRQRSYLSFILICLSALVPGNHAAAQEANLMLPTDHVFSIDCIGVSPDGKYIATSGSDKVLKIWDAHEKKQLLNLPIGEVNNISFSKDNNYLICSSKGTVLLLDAITGGLIREFPGHNDKINTVRFNPSDDLLITSSADHTSMIWNVKTGQLMHVFDEGQRIYLSSFSEDGRKIITVTERGYTWWDASSYKKSSNYTFKDLPYISSRAGIKLYNGKYLIVPDKDYRVYNVLEPAEPRIILFPKDGPKTFGVESFDLSPDETKLLSYEFTYSFDSFIRLYDFRTGKALNVKNIPRPVYAAPLQFTPDSRYYFQADSKMKIKRFGGMDLRVIDSMEGKALAITKTLLSHDGKYFVIMASNNRPMVVETLTGKLLHSFPPFIQPASRYLQSYENYVVQITDLKFSDDDRYLYIISDNTSVTVYDCKTYEIVKHWEYRSAYNSFFLPKAEQQVYLDSSKLFLRNEHGVTARYHINKVIEGRAELTCYDDSGKYLGLVIDNSDRNSDKAKLSIPIYDLHNGNFIKTIGLGQDDAYQTSVFSSDGRKIIVWNYNADKIRIYDLVTAKGTTIRFGYKTKPIFRLTKDNQQLYIITASGECAVIDLKSRKTITIMPGFSNIKGFTISDSNNKLVAESYDHRCNIWDCSTGKFLYSYIPIGDEDYLVTDNSGRYDGTIAARKLLYYVCGREIVTLDQLRELTWQPGLAAKVTGVDKEPIEAKKLSEIDICGVTPLVEQEEPTDSNYRYKIMPRSGGLGETLLWVNGQNIKTYQPKELVKKSGYYELLIKRQQIKNRMYSDMPNTIDVRAYAQNVRLISKGNPSTVEGEQASSTGKHHLYCIAVGITKYKGKALSTLHYAAQDAEDMSRAVSAAAGKLLDTSQSQNSVTSYLLTSNETKDDALLPYRDNIRKVFQEVARKATADDIVVVFLSGHGVLHTDKQFYYLTADASAFSLDGVESLTAISTDTLKKWLLGINANKKVLILDACNSGQTVESLSIKKDIPDDQRRSLENLNVSTGTFILAASASGQPAFEMSKYGQGILAYNLLLGIKSGGGLRDNKYVEVATWFRFASEKVNLMAGEIGERQLPQSWGVGSATGIDIGIADQTLKNSIQLSSKKPTFGKPIAFNVNVNDDNLSISDEIQKKLTDLQYQGGKSSKLVFISTAKGADVFKVNFSYRTEAGTIQGKMVLLLNGQVIVSRDVSFLVSDLEKKIDSLVDEITNNL